MTDLPSRPARTIVIATPDSRMRANFTAQLVQRGENVISITNFRSPKISDRVRANAILLVAEESLGEAPWIDTLRDHGWTGQILVMGTDGSNPSDEATAGLSYCPHPFDIQECIALL